MARRGQCRCGLILTFHRTARGYKTRCPSCGSVVRLRVKGKKRRGPRPDGAATQPPADAAPPAPDDIDVELVSLSQLARTAPAPPRRGKWWLIVAGGGAALLLAAASGLVWWFW